MEPIGRMLTACPSPSRMKKSRCAPKTTFCLFLSQTRSSEYRFEGEGRDQPEADVSEHRTSHSPDKNGVTTRV